MSARLATRRPPSAMKESELKQETPRTTRASKSLKRRRVTSEASPVTPKTTATKPVASAHSNGPKQSESAKPSSLNASAHNASLPHQSKKKKRKKAAVPDFLLDVPLTQLSKTEKKKKKKKKSSAPNKKTKTYSVQIQRADFLKWDVSAISKVAVSPNGAFMAVARRSSSIELRRKVVDWTTISVVRCDALDETAAVSSITFDRTGNYLFVGRFNGILDVYSVSPQGLSSLVTLDPGGGAVMSLAVRPGPIFEVAVGGEDGRVRFVSIDEGMKDVSLLQAKQPPLPTDPSHYSVHQGHLSTGMCLSLCWKAIAGNEDDILVCGDSQGGLRWMSGSSKKLLGRGQLPQRFDRPSHIWTVQVVARGEHVVCGDSHGMYSIWSSTSFTMMEENRFEGMAGDLWDSVVLPSENDDSETVIFGCAGGNVASLKSLMSSNGAISWSPSRGRPVHLNDIFTMARIGERGFVTGSADTRLCIFSDFLWKKAPEDCMIMQYHEVAGQNPNLFAPAQGLVISRQQNRIDFWQLPKNPGPDPLLALRLKFPSNGGNLRSCAIASDASRIAVAGYEQFALYDVSKRASEDGTNVALLGSISLSSLPAGRAVVLQGAQDMAFVGSALVAISADLRQLVILREDHHVVFVPKSVIGTGAEFLTHIAVCEATKSVAVSDSLGSIFFGKLSDLLEHPPANPPLTKVATFGTKRMIACMQFSAAGNHFCASLADNSLAICYVGSNQPRAVGVTQKFPSLPSCMSFAKSEKSVLLSGHNFCYAIYWKRKGDVEKEQAGSLVIKHHAFSSESSIISSCVMGPSSIFLAHRPWEAQQAFLPSVLPKKMFGV